MNSTRSRLATEASRTDTPTLPTYATYRLQRDGVDVFRSLASRTAADRDDVAIAHEAVRARGS